MSTFEGLGFGELIAAESEGVEWELGVDFEFGFPGVSVFGGGCSFPEAGDAIGIIAVVDFGFGKVFRGGWGDREMGGVVFDLKGGGRSDGDVLVFTCEVLFEPVVEEDPLLRAGAVVGVPISGDAPVFMREEIHGAVDAVEGGVEIV